jgi:lipopolysaccharide biosynthesis glycosyltransferase
MEILCACDARFLPHTATMLCSLLENNTGSQVHLLYSSLGCRDLKKLDRFVKGYRSTLTCYEMIPANFHDLRVDKWASIANYYRLLAPQLLPDDVDKVLYLDSDIIVRSSLNELWRNDLTNYALAAVANLDEPAGTLGLPRGAKYFNSGVLLINLTFWRQHSVSETALAFIRNHPEKVEYWDQDALNAILVGRWIELPRYWNMQDDRWEKNPAIVHFCSVKKPWHWSSDHLFKSDYHEYRVKTPWPRYQPDGMPGLGLRLDSSLRRFVDPMRSRAQAALPSSLRKWLRSRARN